MGSQKKVVNMLLKRIEVLETRIRVLTAERMELEAEMTAMRDEVVYATRRLQEVVEWNTVE